MKIIGIAGGTGSGKSTFTNRLKQEFSNDIAVLYHDNYYKRQDHLPMKERKKTNYDHPSALDTDQLVHDLEQLKKGYPIDSPVYDFSQHNRTNATILITPHPVILVEGILVLSDDRLRNLMDMKIFVEADADERILRRVVRDVKERGRDIEGIVEQYLNSVKPMHYIYVEPTKALADLVINSGMNEVAFQVVKTQIQDWLKK